MKTYFCFSLALIICLFSINSSAQNVDYIFRELSLNGTSQSATKNISQEENFKVEAKMMCNGEGGLTLIWGAYSEKSLTFGFGGSTNYLIKLHDNSPEVGNGILANQYNIFTLKRQNGYSELFLNGVLIKKLGMIDFPTSIKFECWTTTSLTLNVEYLKYSQMIQTPLCPKCKQNPCVCQICSECGKKPCICDLFCKNCGRLKEKCDCNTICQRCKQNPCICNKPTLCSTPRTDTYVLIIANWSYEESLYSSLEYPENSANDFARLCKDNFCIDSKNIDLKFNMSREKMRLCLLENDFSKNTEHALQLLHKALQDNSIKRIIIFYIGHGAVDAKGCNYLVPKDASSESKSSGIELRNFYSYLINENKKQNKEIIIFLDACHLGSKNAAKRPEREWDGDLENIDKGKIVVISSAHKNQQAKGSGGMSIFVRILREKVTGKWDGTLGDLYDYLVTEVPKKSTGANVQNPDVSKTNDLDWRNIRLR